MINLPIFRAKKIDSDEYVEGYLLPKFENNYYISLEWSMDFGGYTPDFEKIDISTLSIHFLTMLDSQGNKIFASLQEDGKGGDITDKGICMYNSDYHQFRIITNIEKMNWVEITRKDLENYLIKIIGIQQ